MTDPLIVTASQVARSHTGAAGSYVHTFDGDFGRHFGLKRLGIHHVLLLPGCRSSLPHARSMEEEFIYVLTGYPHIWIDGCIHRLRPGHAAGFPAGTGISHCLINNSNLPIELLVVRQTTNSENRCVYPMNPEECRTSRIRWEDAPVRSLGPNSGKPGDLTGQSDAPPPACVAHVDDVTREGAEFHYPGDSETFGTYARFTDPLGLKKIGVSHVVRPPGRRGCYPHAHSLEEELVYVLKGEGLAWLDGEVYPVRPGHAIAYPPEKGVAHVMINEASQPLVYLTVGEADVSADLYNYPLNPFRNSQCEVAGRLWRDIPNRPMGPHSGRPVNDDRRHLEFAHATVNDEPAILNLFERSPSYFLGVNGCLPSLATVRTEMTQAPPKTLPEYRRDFLIVKEAGVPVGVIDLHHNHPAMGITYVAILLLPEDLHGRGLGRRIYELAEDYCRRVHKTKVMRLGVSEAKNESAFWRKMGFSPNGHTYQWKGEAATAKVTEMEKMLK